MKIVKRLLEYREVSKLKSTYVDALPDVREPEHGPHPLLVQPGLRGDRPPGLERPEPAEHPGAHARGRKPARGLRPARARREHGEWVLSSPPTTARSSCASWRTCHGDPEHMRRGLRRKARTSTPRRPAHLRRRALTPVDREMRSPAKAINFGLLYGMGPSTPGARDRAVHPEAKEFIERYFSSFPSASAGGSTDARVGPRERATSRPCWAVGASITGHQRSQNSRVTSDGRERRGQHARAGLGRGHHQARDDRPGSRASRPRTSGRAQILLQVHDELLLEVPTKRAGRDPRAGPRVAWKEAVVLDVPLRVDFGHGANWLEAH